MAPLDLLGLTLNTNSSVCPLQSSLVIILKMCMCSHVCMSVPEMLNYTQMDLISLLSFFQPIFSLLYLKAARAVGALCPRALILIS